MFTLLDYTTQTRFSSSKNNPNNIPTKQKWMEGNDTSAYIVSKSVHLFIYKILNGYCVVYDLQFDH